VFNNIISKGVKNYITILKKPLRIAGTTVQYARLIPQPEITTLRLNNFKNLQ